MALFTVLAKGFSQALNTSTKKAEFHHNINTMQKNMLVTCSDGVKKQQFTCTEFIDHERMKKCLVKECKSLLEISGAKTINSVYFGGGTPSLAKPSTFSAILECLQQKGVLNPNAEVTLEANPTSAESHKLRDFKTAGINRLSLGVQSLSEDELAVLGRQGSCLESLKSLDMAKVLFPGRVSVDLMFGRPKQTAPEWERELEEILPLCDNHISIYQLTLHRGTSLFRQVQEGKLVVPDSDQMADLYLTTVDVEEFGHGTRKKVFQSNAVILEEIIMLGLRTSEGIPNERFNHYITATSSGSLREIFEGCSDVRDFMAEGLLQLDERGLRATPSGLAVVDTLTASIALHLEKYLKQS